jgi:ADP-ribosylglycohydrolase
VTTRQPLTPEQADRAAGVLLAQACGDALGAGTEFQSTPLPASTPIAMTGGGAFDWAPGEWTDDTQMSIVILQAAELAQANQGSLTDHLDDIVSGWLTWAKQAKDVGTHTRTVLNKGATTAAGLAQAAAAVHQRHGRSGGNGSLMRTAPVALALFSDTHGTAAAARAISDLTHHDPHAGDACVLWCAAIQHAITRGAFDLVDQLQLLPADRRDYWQARIDEAEANDATTFEKNGWVVHALQAAWSLITRTPAHDPTQHLSQALEGAARLANDTDTVGAIAGALLGARWGASAVPEQWQRIVHGWPGLTGADLARRGLALTHG